ncbi:MAG: inorganic phosphate transporter [Betaproteobacteria bacterium]|nr:inorganic phosphate transporter [Betaproteobacteria bacterium]
MSEHGLLVMAILVVVALAFDFMNGFHDAANSIALMVSTRLLTPQAAVAWAAFFNFVAFLFFGLHVAKTVGSGIVSPAIIDNAVIFGALCGAISWNVITWWFGIPSSSSHALVGGLVGAALAKAGWSVIIPHGLIWTSAAIILSPLLGLVLSLALAVTLLWALENASPARTEAKFNKLQFVSSSLYSLGHGGNDAQKTMGIIAVLLYANGYLEGAFHVPFWVVLSCQFAMGLGTLFGGWRIVRTMGIGITRIRPTGAFSAQTAGAVTLFLATWMGIPVSTTHTITGAIVGVGISRRVSAVRWGIAARIIWAWVLTIPLSGLIAAIFWNLGRGFLG